MFLESFDFDVTTYCFLLFFKKKDYLLFEANPQKYVGGLKFR